MERFVNQLKTGWTARRFIGLFIGLFVAGQSILLMEPLLGVISVYFLYQILTNTGCFGAQACGIEYHK
jgi:hypothetical protein